MKDLIHRLHARLGDFWWYSLMVFCAARVADCMNVFVGLWLVPKYVDPADLGAVMPLTQFAGCLAIPISVFASTFRNEITELSVRGEFGKLKTLLRGTFVATGIFLVFALLVSWVVLPPFLERIRIARGSLGILVILTAFVTSIAPIFNNALQALKKFKATSVIGILGAPIRLLTMLVTMPLRALSGYFVGQTSTPAFGIVASVFSLKKELSVRAEPYWDRAVFKRVAALIFFFAISSVAGNFSSLVENTIMRQRLPELDSAAYYMVTRFSEIANFVAATLTFTIFPYAAELAAQKRDTRPLIVKSSLVVAGFSILLMIFFALFGRQILSFLPHGQEYSSYYWAIPWIIGINAIMFVSSQYFTVEVAANRFGYLKWQIPLYLANPIALLLITGYGYYGAHIPNEWADFIATHNITSLSAMLWWFTGFNIIRSGICVVAMMRQKGVGRGQ